MMMIRITLCVIFILGGAWTGMFYAGQLSSRKRALGELMRGLQLFKNEIYYTRERLEKAAARAGRASDGASAGFFEYFAGMLHERSEEGAGHVWEDAARGYFGRGNILNEKDIEALSAMGQRLGSTDIKGQMENIERTLKELSIRYTDAGSMEAQKGKVYRTAGVAGGILCAVLIV